MNKTSRTRKSGANRPNNSKNVLSIAHPPQLGNTVITHVTTLRYRSIAAAVVPISFQNLLDTYLIAQTAIAGNDVFQTVKVKSVKLWAVPVIGGTTTVSCEFGGTTTGIVGDQKVHSDMSMGIEPAHVVARPSPQALASDYQISSGAIAFTLNVPAGAVIDVEVQFRGQFAAAVAAQNALVGATPGAFYLRGLDGIATAGSNFPPELSLLGYSI